MNYRLFKKKSRFATNTAILTSGVFIAQILPMIAYPIIGRLYTPEMFGLLSTLTSITSVLAIVATLKYESSILIVPNKTYAASFVCAILLMSLVILAITGVLLWLFSGTFSDILNEPSLEPWLWVCPISAFCIVLFNCFNEWCVRNSYFKPLAINKIVNGGTIPLFKILFAFGKWSSIGLILGDLAGHIVTGVSCAYRAIKYDGHYLNTLSKRKMRFALLRYSDCPKYVFPTELLNKIGFVLPVFFIMAHFSSKELGFYSMATMILAVPTSVISRAIRDTFRQRANDIYTKQHSCINFYWKVIRPMSVLSIVFFGILYLIAPELFSLILGSEWKTAGVYCKILCPMIAINFVSEVGSCMYIVAEKMNLYLIWGVLYFILTLIAMILGTMLFKKMESTLICLMIARCIVYLVDLTFTIQLAKYGKLI